jgi:copper resistance protein C
MRISNARKPVTFLSLFAGSVLATSAAFAHAQLMKSEPAADADIAAPQSIVLHFDDDLIAKFSSFKLTDVDGASVAITPAASQDSKSLTATPAKPLAPGLYTVSWTATSQDDGHKTTGTFSFTVK